MRLADSYWLFLWAALALVPLMPSSDSLWIDEAQTWRYARQPALAGWQAEMASDRFSESQMPLGMFSAWVGARFLGTSEWAMRAPNMLWAAGSIFIFYLLGRSLHQPFLPLLLAVQPYLWFYTNEARPYTLQIFSGAILLYSLYQGIQLKLRGNIWALFFGAGAVLACASSMLGLFSTIPAVLILFYCIHKEKWPVTRAHLAMGMFFTATLIPLGLYYGSKVLQGAGGAKIWKVGISNIAYSCLEFSGFAGLLPARQALRAMARNSETICSVWPSASPRAVLAAFLISFFLLMGIWLIKSWKQLSGWFRSCLFFFVASFFLLWCAAAVVHFPFWGRHLSSSFPAYVCLTGAFLSSLLSKGLRGKALVIAFFISLTASSLFLRFSPDHAKDDYRGAAHWLLNHSKQGETIWWAADSAGGRYYKIFSPNPGEAPATRSLHIMNPDLAQLETLALPKFVALSKLDVYDAHGAIQQWLKTNSFQQVAFFQSFTIWATP
jgi:hypothetical protein